MKWVKDDVELLEIGLNQGWTYKEIGNELNRTELSVKVKANRLGLISLNSKQKTTKQFIKEMKLINPNIEILGTYVSAHIKIKCICLFDGYVWYSKPTNLLTNKGCSKCAGNNKKTHKQFIEEVCKINPNIEILDDYINANTNIKVKCLLDGHRWKVSPAHLLGGRGCPECAKRNHGGSYQCMTKEQADALEYPLYFYHVKLQFEDEIFYKFGLTKNEDRSRYKKYQPYKVIEEISFEEHGAWTAICKEKELISNYIPKHHFGGYTECYLKE